MLRGVPPQPDGTERQVGFARVVLDSAGAYHLCDVVIEEALRGRGLGTKLVQAVTGDQRLQGRFGTLETGETPTAFMKGWGLNGAGSSGCTAARTMRTPAENNERERRCCICGRLNG